MSAPNVGLGLVMVTMTLTIFILSLRHRKDFILQHPERRRTYDSVLLAFLLVSSGILIAIAREIWGVENEGWRTVSFAMSLGGITAFLVGWMDLLKDISGVPEVRPLVEFDGVATDKLSPGLYFCLSKNLHGIAKNLMVGRAALIISRDPPEKVKEKFGVQQTPILWLTKLSGENKVHPHRLEYLTQTLVDFMKKDPNEKLIVLGGIEYLILELGFQPVFKFLTTIKDHAILNNTIVVVPLDEKTLDKKELTILEREFQKLGLKTKI
ncbi:DUF835 domain-containing protein [Thermococcus sp.]